MLVTSYTHNAVDTVLLKLKRLGVPFLRFGRRSSVARELHEHVLDESTDEFASTKELERRLKAQLVFGATCLGVHDTAASMTYDWCVVDEASQITVPVVLVPLLRARRFVLFGDHNQLPPLVRCAEAREHGLGDSLFHVLHRAHPEAVVELHLQYRMADGIQLLANHLTYGNRLVCGNDAVARQTLFQLEPSDLATLPAAQRAVLSRRTVVLVDTDTSRHAGKAVEQRDADAIYNPFEAALVADMVNCLVLNGVALCGVGIITPYRRQVRAIEDAVAQRLGALPGPVAALMQGRRGRPALEISTVDTFQGKDRECVVVSLVRCNSEGAVGELLEDWRRLNVAFTRARSKLIVVGSAGTLVSSNNRFLQQFVRYCQHNGLVESMARDHKPARSQEAPRHKH